MNLPLMPKATAVWLIDNTALSFEQIAEFTGMHELEVQAIADGEVAIGIVGQDPVASRQLTREEIARCEADPNAALKLAKSDSPQPISRAKGARYTPVSKRQDKPDGIAWILKHHPTVTTGQICKLLGTTKPTINNIREKMAKATGTIKARNPVTLGLCTEAALEKVVALAPKPAVTDAPAEEAPAPAHDAPAEAPAAPAAPAEDIDPRAAADALFSDTRSGSE